MLFFLFPAVFMLNLGAAIVLLLRYRHVRQVWLLASGFVLWAFPYGLRTLWLGMGKVVAPWLEYVGLPGYALVLAGLVTLLWRRPADSAFCRRIYISLAFMMFIALTLAWEIATGSLASVCIRAYLMLAFVVYGLWRTLVEPSNQPEKQQPSVLPTESSDDPLLVKLDEYADAVRLWFDNDKPYLNPSFKLGDTAGILPLNRSYLSRVYNEGIGMTFTDYVRKCRLDYSQRLLLEHPDMTVAEVAERSGFGSHSSFHRSFTAAHHGMTPVEYRQAKSPKR